MLLSFSPVVWTLYALRVWGRHALNRAEVMDSPDLAPYGTVDLIFPARSSEDDGATSTEALMSRVDMSESISTQDWAHHIGMLESDDPLGPLDSDDSPPSHCFKKTRLMQSFAFGLCAARPASAEPEAGVGSTPWTFHHRRHTVFGCSVEGFEAASSTTNTQKERTRDCSTTSAVLKLRVYQWLWRRNLKVTTDLTPDELLKQLAAARKLRQQTALLDVEESSFAHPQFHRFLKGDRNTDAFRSTGQPCCCRPQGLRDVAPI